MNQSQPLPAVPWEIDVATVRNWQVSGRAFRLIDCREPSEYSRCRIEGAELIPMREIPQALERLGDPQTPLVIHCHHGGRSLRVAEFLRAQGFDLAQSMAGGIDAWSQQIDPSVPRY